MGEKFGPYELLEPLASGGMAKVYRARMVGAMGFEKVVAIKFMLQTFTGNPELVKMFVDEARLAATLSHGNIVGILDFGERNGNYYITMEYVAGANLRVLLRRANETKRLPPPALAAYVIAEVAKGLDYAHKKTDQDGRPLFIVHRDVSPQNVVLSWTGEVKVLDFGIARSRTRNTETAAGTIKGKYSYMSPEQASGMPLDHRSDIFSLGSVFYELLTGQKAFPDAGIAALPKVRQADFIPPDRIRPELPVTLVRILMKAMARNPEDRFPSGAAMLAELSRWNAEERTHGNAESDAGALAKWVERIFAIADSDLAQKPPMAPIPAKPDPGLLPGWDLGGGGSTAAATTPPRPRPDLTFSASDTPQEEAEERSLLTSISVSGVRLSDLAPEPPPAPAPPAASPPLTPAKTVLSMPVPTDEPVSLPPDPVAPAPPAPLPPPRTGENAPARRPDRASPSGVRRIKLAEPPPKSIAPLLTLSAGVAMIAIVTVVFFASAHLGRDVQETPTPTAAADTPAATPTRTVAPTPTAAPAPTGLFAYANTRPVGILDVSSLPAGATIVLDGKEIAETPSLIPDLAAPHRYLLEVKKEGYADFTREIDIVDDTAVQIVATLRTPEVPGKIKIRIPARQTAYLDGRRIGTGPIGLTVEAQPGPHQIRLRDPNDVLVKDYEVQVTSGKLAEPDM